MTNTQDAVAAFLAKGGAIAKVDATASCGMTDRQWHRAQRDDVVTVILGKAYLPSHAFAVLVANCLYQVSDRNHYAKARNVIAEFNADPMPEIGRYDMRLRWAIADMLAAIEDVYDATRYDKTPKVMSNDLFHALRAAYKAMR